MSRVRVAESRTSSVPPGCGPGRGEGERGGDVTGTSGGGAFGAGVEGSGGGTLAAVGETGGATATTLGAAAGAGAGILNRGPVERVSVSAAEFRFIEQRCCGACDMRLQRAREVRWRWRHDHELWRGSRHCMAVL